MSSWSSHNKSKSFNIDNSVLNKIKSSVFSGSVNLVNYNSGKNGKVYSIKQNQIKVLKVSKLTQNSNLEATFSIMAGEAGLGPKVYKTQTVGGYQVILQEKMHGTLQTYMKNNDFTLEHYRNIENLVQQLHNLGICHKDLHVKNIMYKMQNGKPVFKVIDFSRAIYKNGPCSQNRNKLNELSRRVNRRTNTLQNSTSPHMMQRLEYTSANYRTP